MSEHQVTEGSAIEAREPETAPAQNAPPAASASPSFAGTDQAAPLQTAEPDTPGVPASQSAPPEKESAPAAPDESATPADPIEIAAEEKPSAPVVAEPSPDALSLKSELERVAGELAAMQKAAADRVESHRMQVLRDLGLRKDAYSALAPEADPATPEGDRALKDWALENPGLFKTAPELPSEKAQGSPQLGLLMRSKKTWADVFND